MADGHAPQAALQANKTARFDRGTGLHLLVFLLFLAVFALGVFAKGPAAWTAGVLYAG